MARIKHSSNQTLEVAAERIGFPVTTRMLNALLAEGIQTERQLLAMSERDLMRVPNMGDVSRGKCMELQRHLRGEIDVQQHLLDGLQDAAELLKDAPPNNRLALQARAKINQVLREYKNRGNQ